MLNNRINQFGVFVLSLLFITSCGAKNKSNQIGDKQFEVTTMEKGKPESATKEVMVFTDSTFDNLQCHEWGFSATNYTATKSGEDYNFEAVMTSPNEGTMSWKGMVMGDFIHGEMTWHKEGQADIQYTFEGNAL